jgi:hypothetical protein
MSDLRQIICVITFNFRQWRKNPRIVMTFALVFILCFLLTDKAVNFAQEYGTTMQVVEAFVWTFGDSNSIMLSSLLLLLLFADMPFLSAGTPYYLVRMNRRIWLIGQALYITLATGIYMVFILISTSVLSMRQSFIGNMWSETAAILGYSGAGREIALPAFVKTLEMSRPYDCMGTILLLMLLYALLMSFIMLAFNISRGQRAGIISVVAFSLYGFLLNPRLFTTIFQFTAELTYKANIIVGWLSPLNQATYHLHNFGYDLLPKLWMTYLIFGLLIVAVFIITLRSVRQYNFNFMGTED